MAYRIYISDSMQIICRNTGAYTKTRYADIAYPEHDGDEAQTGAEIAVEVITNAGLEVRYN